MLLPVKKNKIYSPFISTLGKWGLQNKGHATEMPDFSMTMLSSCLCYRKSIIQAMLYYFIFCRLTAGNWCLIQTFFLSFEANDDKMIWSVLGVNGSGGKNYIAKLIYATEIECILQTALILPVWKGGGGGLLVAYFASSMWHVPYFVTVSIYCFAC